MQHQGTLTPSLQTASVTVEIAPQAEAPPRSKRTILLVDDEPDTLASYQLLLATRGFEVITAASAAAALQRVAESVPDLIITDFSMSRMNGLELCRVLRERTETRGVPIILYTASELTDSLPGGNTVLVTKPAEFEPFIKLIQALLTV